MPLSVYDVHAHSPLTTKHTRTHNPNSYDRSKTLKANVAISPPIMSRFDLFFVVLDECNPATDQAIARHIVGVHRQVGYGGYVRGWANRIDRLSCVTLLTPPRRTCFDLNKTPCGKKQCGDQVLTVEPPFKPDQVVPTLTYTVCMYAPVACTIRAHRRAHVYKRRSPTLPPPPKK